MLAVDFVFWGFLVLITLLEFSIWDYICCKNRVKPLNKREIDDHASDIASEKKKVETAMQNAT